MNPDTAALELREIDKRYGETEALAGASLRVRPGTIHVLLGENGAGKTTLLRVAAGLVQPDAGVILVGGSPVRWRTHADARSAGLGVVQQHFALVPPMTVAENVAIAEPRLRRRFSPREAAAGTQRLAASLGLTTDPTARVGHLPVSAQQRVEILKAASRGSHLLLLDEPTSVLAPDDSRHFFRWLREFVSGGRTAIVITHRVREALQHGDDVTVLRGGRSVLTTSRSGVSESALVAAILGNPAASPGVSGRPPGKRSAHAVIQLDDVSIADRRGSLAIRGATLQIYGGEVTGIAGVEGAGQRELLRAMAGRLPPVSGRVVVPERVGFIPEDRLRDALIEEFSLTENFALREAGARRGVLRWPPLRAATASAMAAFDIRGGTPELRASALSGGNQQKFVIARELHSQPPAIVAENPTRGLDVRAAAAVLEHLWRASAAGSAVIIYSTDVDELVGVAHRVLVCYAGRVTEVAPVAEAIGAAMVAGR